VVANEQSENIGVLLNQGNGSFAAVVTFSSGGNYPQGVATADFNADGYADVVVGNDGPDNIGVLLSNGGGSFAPLLPMAAEEVILLLLPQQTSTEMVKQMWWYPMRIQTP
jgi:hypothetical protein